MRVQQRLFFLDMSQQDHTHWWRDGDASAAPSSLQIGHHQAVVSPVRDECCAGAAGRSPREEPTLEGAAARASGVDVEAPRLDCSADEWHDSERPRERRNQPSWVSGPRANASDAGLCNMARRRFPASSNFASACGFREPPLRFRHETFCGAYMKPLHFAPSARSAP